MARFIKKRIEIIKRSVTINNNEALINETTTETREGDNIKGIFDMDAICGIVTLELPYNFSTVSQATAQSEINNTSDIRLKKYDRIRIYYAELESDREPLSNEWNQILDGFVNSIQLTKSKDAVTYLLECWGTLGLANTSTLYINSTQSPIQDVPNILLQKANLQAGELNPFFITNPLQQQDIIPQSNVSVNLGFLTGITAQSISSKDAKQAIVEYKKRYGLYFHQDMDGRVRVVSPIDIINTNTVAAWDFNVDNNIFDIDYGDLTSNIDGVIVYGFGGAIGEALDITALQSKGINQNPDGTYNSNLLRFERRDLTSEEDLQKVAREKLLEITRNFLTTIRVPFNPGFRIGQGFTITDNDIYSGNELFFIKNINFTISKDDVSCLLQGYTHSLTTLPDELVTQTTGAFDVDTLGIRNKVAEGAWRNFDG